MTFQQWFTTMDYCPNVGDALNDDSLLNKEGFVFGADSSFIMMGAGGGATFWTISGISEFASDSLQETAKWLWENHSKHEVGTDAA